MLKRKDLNSILSGFTKIQKKLEKYITQVGNDLSINSEKIVELENDRHYLNSQVSKANTVYANLNKLLGE